MDYKKARDLAWKLLIDNNISSLPIDINDICRRERINLFTYRQGKNFIKELNLEEHTLDNDAFSIRSIIFYNDENSEQRQRFSIAHELGHIFLHTDRGEAATVYNREPSPNDDPIEAEANIFASRLLIPLCVIQFLNLNSAKEIAEFCNVSYTAANNRYARLCEIRKRNSDRRKNNKHGTFLLSKLERQVIDNFKNYIEKNKKERIEEAQLLNNEPEPNY